MGWTSKDLNSTHHSWSVQKLLIVGIFVTIDVVIIIIIIIINFVLKDTEGNKNPT